MFKGSLGVGGGALEEKLEEPNFTSNTGEVN